MLAVAIVGFLTAVLVFAAALSNLALSRANARKLVQVHEMVSAHLFEKNRRIARLENQLRRLGSVHID
jgi:hypothetical protein